jgi:hypothetical protein
MAEPEAIRLGRRESIVCWLVARLIDPSLSCLSRSTALTAYLRALGLPAQLVIGRAYFLNNAIYSFHAWTEMYGTVIDDDETVPSRYAVILRLPKDAAIGTTVPVLSAV